MTYATRQDLEDRFGAEEIAHRAADPDNADLDRTVQALADAAAEIDGTLAVAYDLPLAAGVWPQLRGIQCDLARAKLYDDASLDAPQHFQKAAHMRLQALRDGKAQLIDQDGAAAPRKYTPERTGPVPAVTTASLEGY